MRSGCSYSMKILCPLAAILGFLGISLLAGCGQHSGKTMVIMQHPETMEFVNCKVDAWATPVSYAKNARCVEDLKKQGYIVWGER